MKCFGLGWIGLTAFALLAFAPPARAQRPNVLVVVLDDVGVDKLSIYAPPVTAPPMPQLTALAGAGVRFAKAYASPLCSPTRATLMTGRYAFRTGMGDVASTYTLPTSEVTLAEMLKTVTPTPYVCGAFGKWHLSTQTDTTHPIMQGFDSYVGATASIADHFDWDLIRADTAGVTSTAIGSPAGPFDETTFTASITSYEAETWINAQNTPFFAYVCFNAPHAPYQVPPLTLLSAATQATITGLGYAPGDDLTGMPDDHLAYDWMLEAVDTELANLLTGIAAKLANTTILVVTDNGTPAQVIDVPPYDDTHAKGSVYEQGTRVGLVASGKGVNAMGLTCQGLVHAVDIFSTVAALTGAPLPAGVTLDSSSFRPMLTTPTAASARTQVFTQKFTPNGIYTVDPAAAPGTLTEHLRAMNDGHYKYVRIGLGTPVEMAFNLLTDPTETNDLWPSFATLPPPVKAKLMALKTSMISLSGY
jgi:arylsulfatase A-like enzyme